MTAADGPTVPGRDAGIVGAEDARAMAAGKIGADGSRHGSVDGHRAMIGIGSRSRRRCACCGQRATHVGLGDGLALMNGCEMTVRRWVRDGYPETSTRTAGR